MTCSAAAAAHLRAAGLGAGPPGGIHGGHRRALLPAIPRQQLLTGPPNEQETTPAATARSSPRLAPSAARPGPQLAHGGAGPRAPWRSPRAPPLPLPSLPLSKSLMVPQHGCHYPDAVWVLRAAFRRVGAKVEYGEAEARYRGVQRTKRAIVKARCSSEPK
ncbi:hypothetical protein HPB52_019671 [Rhipicephalus sanguineus]|uniref:Uncharacterized protein n=1 Tax=Rhipicephalus sanguineus TaxID=34632 RepID=A0A9D4SVB2_RHISA|nr:hypothetical protein HPB52_019671 [Rhipicephalus sanguineus]